MSDLVGNLNYWFSHAKYFLVYLNVHQIYIVHMYVAIFLLEQLSLDRIFSNVRSCKLKTFKIQNSDIMHQFLLKRRHLYHTYTLGSGGFRSCFIFSFNSK